MFCPFVVRFFIMFCVCIFNRILLRSEILIHKISYIIRILNFLFREVPLDFEIGKSGEERGGALWSRARGTLELRRNGPGDR